MSTKKTSQAKIEKPHAHSDTPREVVADPALSTRQKVQALDTLEQDARLLSTAAREGMTGGELSNLHEVLNAQEALELPPIDAAYAIVLHDLQSRPAAGRRSGLQAMIEHAIEALEAVRNATAQASAAPGTTIPGSDAEIAKEAALEKLDP